MGHIKDNLLNIRLFLILVLPFLFYHNTTLVGPDGEVYLAVSHQVVTGGSLNTLPETLADVTPYQITKTRHSPIHQNIGGVLFIVPATALAVVSHSCALLISNLPQRFYDITFHEGVWLGCITYLLAVLSCLLSYRVARCYHGSTAVTTALFASVFGGPLFVYAFFYPCNTNLPAAFLASLLLYIYQFVDREKSVAWMLMGGVLGLGVFVRQEFAVWGLLLLFAVFQEKPYFRDWRTGLKRLSLAAFGSLLFIVPSLMIRLILFGEPGSTYSIQADLANLTSSYLMLCGTRNGLFVFWPVLLIALMGYFIRISRNPPLYHIMFIVLTAVTITSGTIIFWNGELGHSLGQRWFLVAFPCFVLYLSRLFDLSKKYFFLVFSLSVVSSVWALLLWAAYGMRWSFPNDVAGFLMPLHYSRIIDVLTGNYPLFIPKLLQALLVPKHVDVVWMMPLFAAVIFCALYLGNRIVSAKRFEYLFAILILISCVTTVFLAGARERGEQHYREIAAGNRQATFIIRNYEVDFEIISSMVDSVAFYMELGDHRRVRHVKDKTKGFLKKEAPDQLNNFEQSCAALELRQSLGWYRLFPELIHFSLLEWYQSALDDMLHHRRPSNAMEHFLY
jgi:hypothetical protein